MEETELPDIGSGKCCLDLVISRMRTSVWEPLLITHYFLPQLNLCQRKKETSSFLQKSYEASLHRWSSVVQEIDLKNFLCNDQVQGNKCTVTKFIGDQYRKWNIIYIGQHACQVQHPSVYTRTFQLRKGTEMELRQITLSPAYAYLAQEIGNDSNFCPRKH